MGGYECYKEGTCRVWIHNCVTQLRSAGVLTDIGSFEPTRAHTEPQEETVREVRQ